MIARTLHLRKFVFTLHLYLIYIATTISHAQAPADIQLIAGSDDNEGIVEIFDPTSKQWGYICGAGWNQAAGQVACRQLGYEGAVASMPMATAGVVSRPVLLSNVRCRGDEPAITDCQHVSFGNQECDPLQISWVICDGPKTTVAPTRNKLASQLPSPVATEINGDQVTIDYSKWLEEVRHTTYFIRVVLKKRKISDKMDVVAPFEIEDKLPKMFTYRTVKGLEGRTSYEFVTEAVQLSEQGGEVYGHRSGILRVDTPCAGPPSVRKLQAQTVYGIGTVLDLTWDVPFDKECPATDYQIEYTQTTIGQCRSLKNDGQIVQAGISKDTRFQLTRLMPYSTYTVQVKARSEFGESESTRITVTTSQAVPSGKPRNIVTKYIGEDTLVATWDSPPCEERNSPVTGYSYILVDEGAEEVTQVGEVNVTRLEVTGPVAYKKYKILIAAKSEFGKGPYAIKTVTSKADAWHICGRTMEETRNPAQRVTSAFVARKGDFPWMAQLWYIPHGKLYCAGSVLNERWILTATHCIKDKNAKASELKIQLGDYDRLLPEQEQAVYDVEEIITHPEFDYDTFDNDVALIKVSRPIEFTNYIRPICMPPKKLSKAMLQVGTYGTVAGWGKQREDSEAYPRFLKEISVPVRGQKTCRRSTNFSITANMFCAGYEEANKGDACEGDSGAPFVMKHTDNRWYVLGIVSWGEGCDKADKFGFYTRLHRYTAWVKRYTRLDLLKLLPADLQLEVV